MSLRVRAMGVTVLGVGVAVACGSAGTTSPGGNFDTGSQPLQLLPAPPGLCGGDGSQKQCDDPAGCASRGAAAGGVPAGSAGAYNGGAPQLPSYGDSPYPYGGSGTGGASAIGPSGGVDAGITLPPACPALPDGGPDLACAGDGGSAPPSAPFGKSQQALDSQCTGLDSKTAATLYLSADDSNSTASASIARKMLRQGQRVPSALVRPYEFLNYYDFAFQPAEHNGVRIVPQLSSCPDGNGQLGFQVALQSEHRSSTDRPPLNVTFVLDTSGSMAGEPIAIERAAVRAAASQLRVGDVVSMVTWSTTQAEILSGHVVSGPSDPAIVAAADALAAGGGTDLEAGLRRGYALAEAHFAPNRVNRVLLISDGEANVGVTDADFIAKYANDEEGGEGIYLAGIGVGTGYNDTLMDAVTEAGRGAYVFLDSAEEASRMLGERFLKIVDVAARAVRLEMTLPWYLGVHKFYGEAISTDPTKVLPQHLSPNSAMLFFQILQACDPSLLNGDDRIRLRATWQEPFSRMPREAVIDSTLNGLAGDDRELTKGAAIAGYAEALVQAGSVPSAQAAALFDAALSHVHAAKNAATDPDLAEVAALLELAKAAY